MKSSRGFTQRAPSAKAPKAVITLGGGSGEADQPPSEAPARAAASRDVPTAVPIPAVRTEPRHAPQEAGGSELPLTRAPRKRAKEVADSTTEAIPAPKRARAPSPPAPTRDASREDNLAPTLLEEINSIVPADEDMLGWSRDRLSREGANSLVQVTRIMTSLYFRATEPDELDQQKREIRDLKRRLKAAEDARATAEAARESVDRARVEADEARKTALVMVEKATRDAEAARKEAHDASSRLNNLESLAAFLCAERSRAERFFRAFLSQDTGEDLAWVFGDWARATGRREMLEEVKESMRQVLRGNDLKAILDSLPEDEPSPGPNPYAEADPEDPADQATRDPADVA